MLRDLKAYRNIMLLLIAVVLPLGGYGARQIEQTPLLSSCGGELLAGVEWLKQGAYDSANLCFYRSIDKFRPTSEVSSSEFHKNISVLLTHSYRAMNVTDSAVFYAQRVIGIAKTIGDSALQVDYTYTLATIYGQQTDSLRAQKFYIQSAELAQKIGRYAFAATSYAAASTICRDAKMAVRWSKMAVECAQNDDDLSLRGRVLCNLAGSYYADGQLHNAENSYRTAMDYYGQVSDSVGFQIAELGLMFIHSKAGRQDSAWHYMRSLKSREELTYNVDSIVMPNTLQEVTFDLLCSRLEAEQRTVEFGILSRQYWQEQATSLRMRIWLISIAGGLVISILLLLYGRQKLRSRANSRYIEGLESERKRISKELHDGVCNDLLALEMRVSKGDAVENIDMLRNVRRDVRMLSHELMPPAFQYAAIDEILNDYASSLPLPAGVVIEVTIDEQARWEEINHAYGFQIYRIVQEAVSNSLKHSAATEIKVDLKRTQRQIQLTIADNGCGCADKQSTDGLGFRIMRDRAISVGGSIEIETNDRGTKVKFTHHG